jgi:hypothetical protein
MRDKPVLFIILFSVRYCIGLAFTETPQYRTHMEPSNDSMRRAKKFYRQCHWMHGWRTARRDLDDGCFVADRPLLTADLLILPLSYNVDCVLWRGMLWKSDRTNGTERSSWRNFWIDKLTAERTRSFVPQNHSQDAGIDNPNSPAFSAECRWKGDHNVRTFRGKRRPKLGFPLGSDVGDGTSSLGGNR